MATGRLLGCGVPSVYITDVGGGQPLAKLDVTSVTWGRVLDEVSNARVHVSVQQEDPRCSALLGKLEPWEYELLIHRDADEVWAGPVMEPTYTWNDMTITARDLVQWFERRILPRDRAFTDVDLGTIAARYLADALEIDDSPNISFSVGLSGVTGTRSVLGINKRRAADELRELARGALDFTTVGRTIRFGGKELDVPRLPLLTERSFEITQVRKAGLQMGNHWFVFGTTPSGVTTPLVGEAGGPPNTPIVQQVVNEPSVKDLNSATAAAETRYDLFRTAPEMITGRFLETAPVDINDLVPGSVAEIRQQVGFKRIDGEYRLLSIEDSWNATENGIVETVNGIFEPLGSVEEGL